MCLNHSAGGGHVRSLYPSFQSEEGGAASFGKAAVAAGIGGERDGMSDSVARPEARLHTLPSDGSDGSDVAIVNDCPPADTGEF